MPVDAHPLQRFVPSGRIDLDIGRARMRMRDVKTPLVTVEHADARLADLGVLSDLCEAASLDDAAAILRGTAVEIDDLQLRIPQDTLTLGLQGMVEGEPELTLQGVDRFRLAGRQDGWLEVPYVLEGRLGETKDGRVLADVQRATAFGVIPVTMPACFMVAAKLARRDVAFERDGGRFMMDPAASLPDGVAFKLTGLRVEGTDLILNGSARWQPRAAADPVTTS